jgi:hypothetical protein
MGASISHDRPLSASEALGTDKLDRKGFAETAVASLLQVSAQSGFVLSVEGEWGSGKTSTLALMEALLADEQRFSVEPVIVHFNPWLVGDRDALLKQFLNAIASKLALTDNAGVGQRVAKELKAYSKVFDVLKLIPGAEPWATIVKAVSDVFLKVGEAVGAVSDHKALDLQGRKRLVEAALRAFGRPIVVFIDDIDRLFPNEVFEMVRIVKAVGDLPHVGYVLAWDSAYVSEALRAANVPQAATYLDKIVQVRLPLPKLSTSAKGRLVDEALDALAPEALKWHFKDDEQRLSSLYFSGLRELLEQPRDIMRVFNTVGLLEPGLRGEVSLADIVGLAALKVKAPEVFELLRKSPQYFVGRLPGDMSVLTKSEDLVKEGADARDAALRACSAPDATRRVLRFLFPFLAGAGNNNAIYRVEAVEGHIAAPVRLLVALQHSISPMDVSLMSARRYLVDPASRLATAAALTADNCVDFLDAVADVALSNDGRGICDAHLLCLSLAQLVEAEPFAQASERGGFLSARPASSCKSTIAAVMEAASVSDEQAVWSVIARDPLVLSLAVDVIEDRRNEALNERKEAGGDLAGHAVLDDIQVYADNVLRAAKEGRLFKSPQPGYLLWRLAEWMPSVCGEVMSAIQLTDPQLDLFVMAFLNHSRDSIKGNAFSLPEDIKRLEAFMPLADLRKRAQQRLEDTLLDYPLKAAWRAVLEGKKLYAVDGSEARR